jgi:hypothetical protein
MKTKQADANKVEIRKPTNTKLLRTKQEDQWAKRQIDPASLVSVCSEIKEKELLHIGRIFERSSFTV